MGTSSSEPRSIPQLNRRRFIAAAGAMILAAGCGSDDQDAEGEPSSNSLPPTATEAAPTVPTVDNTTAAASGATRVVETPHGDVEIPVSPSRVLATYTTSVDYALALDLPLIAGGAKQGTLGKQFASYQTDPRLSDVTPLDFWPTPNFEQLAAEKPDLIIDDTPFSEEWQPILEGIAPTLNFSEASTTDDPAVVGWQQALRYLGTALAADDKAEAFIEQYDARFAEVRAKVAASAMAGQSVIVTTPYGADLYVQTRTTLPMPKLFEDLGFVYPSQLEAVDPDNAGEVVLPGEQYEMLDSDWLVVLFYSTPEGDIDTSLLEQVSSNPLWTNLPAVQAGNVIQVDSDLNFASPGTAMTLLAEIERLMLA